LIDNVIHGPGTNDIEIKGIDITLSENSTLTCNGVYDFGESMVFNGACPSAYISSNKLKNAQNGFVLRDGGIVGQQGSVGNPADIEWVNSAPGFSNFKATVYNSSGQYSPFFVRSGTLYDPSSSSGGQFLAIPFTVTSGGSINSCLGTLPAFIGASPTDPLVKKIAKQQLDYVAKENVNRFESEKYSYEEIQKDTSLLVDADVQLFYTEMQTSNVEKLKQVSTKINNGDVATANQINANIIAENAVDGNCKTVNTCYLHHLDHTISSTDVSVLEGIANQCPMEGGAGVFKARILLEELTKKRPIYYDGCADAVTRKAQNEDSEQRLALDAEKSSFKLYPNPNNGEFTFTYELTEPAQLIVYTITGQLLNSYELKPESKTIRIFDNGLENGIYFYKVLIKNELKYTGKFAIVN